MTAPALLRPRKRRRKEKHDEHGDAIHDGLRGSLTLSRRTSADRRAQQRVANDAGYWLGGYCLSVSAIALETVVASAPGSEVSVAVPRQTDCRLDPSTRSMINVPSRYWWPSTAGVASLG